MPLYPALDKLAYQEPMLLDERWVMSYAAGLKDYNKNAYFNTTKDNPLGPITAHPCLYWAISWPFMWNRAKEFLKEPMTPQEAGRGVHYSEDVIIHQPLKSNTNIKMSCQAVEALQKKKGCTLLTKYDMYDSETNELLLTHWTSSYYRGVELKGGDVHTNDLQNNLPPPIVIQSEAVVSSSPIMERSISIAFNEAHVYTECSRIWNPIHTNLKVALAAGLPDIILHGTGTFAKATTELINMFESNKNPKNVKRVVCGSFSANVLMPSTIKLRIFSVEEINDEKIVHWDVLNEEKQQAIRGGVIIFRIDQEKSYNSSGSKL